MNYTKQNVGCDESHHFCHTCSFSHRMTNSLKTRRFAIVPALAQPIVPIHSLFDPTKKARMFALMRTFYMSVSCRILVYNPA